jgi:hypothetical protein
MLDGSEIMRIEFGEERFTTSQRGIMHAQMFFENLAPFTHGLESLTRGGAAAVIATQIDRTCLHSKIAVVAVSLPRAR